MFHLTCYEHGELKAVSLATHWAQHWMKSLFSLGALASLSRRYYSSAGNCLAFNSWARHLFAFCHASVWECVCVRGTVLRRASRLHKITAWEQARARRRGTTGNEEQLFAVRGTCLGGIEGDLTSEGGVPSQGDLRCSPSIVTAGALSHPAVLMPPVLWALLGWAQTHVREFGMRLLLTRQPLEFSTSPSGLSYHKPCLPEMLPCWDDPGSPGCVWDQLLSPALIQVWAREDCDTCPLVTLSLNQAL